MTETCQRCGMKKATAAEREGRVASIVHMTCFGADDCATRLAKRVKKLEAERNALLEQLTLLNDVGLETERRWQNVVAMVRKDEQAKAETSLVEASQWRSRAEKAEGILATIDAVHAGNKPSIIEMAYAIRDAEARAKKLEQYLRDCSLAVSVEYDAPHLVPGDVINRIERDSESIDKAEARVRELEAQLARLREVAEPERRHFGAGNWHHTCRVCGAQWMGGPVGGIHPPSKTCALSTTGPTLASIQAEALRSAADRHTTPDDIRMWLRQRADDLEAGRE